MTTETKVEHGVEYEVRDDFTIEELITAIERGPRLVSEYARDERGGLEGDAEGNPTWRRTNYQIITPETNNNHYEVEEGYDDYTDEEYLVWSGDDFTYEGGTIPGLGTFSVVTRGNLGDGHDAWTLLKHEESDRHFLNTGYYSSWDVGEMNDWDEVEPVGVTVTKYRSKDSGKIFANPVVD